MDIGGRSRGRASILVLIGLVLGVGLYFYLNPEKQLVTPLDQELNPLFQAEEPAANNKNSARSRSIAYLTKDGDRKRKSSGGIDRKESGKAQNPSQAKVDYANRATDGNRYTNNRDEEFSNGATDPLLDQDDDGIPQGDTISGQVLDESGQGVPGINLVALVRRLYDSEEEFNVNDNMEERHARTDDLGVFRFVELANGDYEIRTVATDNYSSVNAMLRTGTNSAKLTVVEQREIWIFGQVTDSEKEPLADVQIFPRGADKPAFSNIDGSYGFHVNVRGDRSYTIPFQAEGYRDQKLVLQRSDWHGSTQVERYVTMEPAKVLTTVSGVIRSKTGAPVPSERVYLQSQQHKYKSTSNASGDFVIENVETGGNYALWLLPQGPYQKYREERLTVSAHGLSGLEVILEPVNIGSLAGQMIDTEGRPVSNFTLLVRSEAVRSNRVQVTSDYQGNFAVESLPIGRVRFETLSFPRFTVSGIKLAANEEPGLTPGPFVPGNLSHLLEVTVVA